MFHHNFMKQSKHPPRKITINGLALETGLDRRTIKKRLTDAGIFEPDRHTSETILAALRPSARDARSRELKERKTTEELRKLKIANDAKEAALISKAEVADIASRLTEKFGRLLHKKLVIEYPATVAGLDVAGARIYGKKLNDQIRAEVQGWSSLWEGR